jgi:hypothetical protein
VIHKSLYPSWDIATNKNTKHLYDLLDFDHILPVSSITNYLLSNDLTDEKNEFFHPSLEEHKVFTKQVIYPFLVEKKYI